MFELNAEDEEGGEQGGDEDEDNEGASAAAIRRARAVFQRANAQLKLADATEDRVALLQAWQAFEAEQGGEEDKEEVAKMMPRRVKRRRRLEDDSFEEYLDYIFPQDDAGAPRTGGLLAMMQRKAQQAKEQREAEDS